ncbi:MAG: hypothetical protein KF819_35000 [Labilithrix sp.]|nr:hypothetical protein [Labilithrix sp.]
MVLAAVACSSSGPANPEQDRGIEGEGEAINAPDTNPDGVPYPTDNLGTNPRQGDRPGNKMINYKFYGYPNGDRSQGLQPISLANFFDPTGERVRLIHLQASGSWCIYCKEETKAVTPLKAELDSRKVVWVMSLAEGKIQGTPATSADLDAWIAQFKAPYTHVLDPGNKNFGPFYDAAALPWNADIDARTMEILSSGVGATTDPKKILADLDRWLGKMADGSLPKPQ